MSTTLLRVWESLEFWFSKKPSGYYKFLKPCDHKWYREGDSWCEQLRVSENTFRKSLKKLCTSYQSKSSFIQNEDPFQGKPYACYYDRIRKVTFFFRNNHIANQLTREKILGSSCVSDCVSINTAINKINNNPPKSPLRKLEKKRDVGGLSKGVGKKAESPSAPLPETAVQMHAIWTEETAGKIETPRLSLKFAETLLKALQTYFQNSIEKWRTYCRTVASSKFLMGEVGSFKAWLVWVIRGETIHKVREGGYSVTVPTELQETPMIDDSNPLGEHHEALTKDHPSLRNDLVAFARRVGLKFYHCWLADAEVRAEGETLKFSGLLAFSKERIRSHLEMHHPEWAERVCLG